MPKHALREAWDHVSGGRSKRIRSSKPPKVHEPREGGGTLCGHWGPRVHVVHPGQRPSCVGCLRIGGRSVR